MNIPVSVSFAAGQIGVSGQLQVQAKAQELITVPASTSALLLPLPTGLSTAAFVAVSSLVMTDLTVKFSNIVGATSLTVPAGATLLAYGVATVYVTSAAGGTLQVVAG